MWPSGCVSDSRAVNISWALAPCQNLHLSLHWHYLEGNQGGNLIARRIISVAGKPPNVDQHNQTPHWSV
ncbi:hypothetical protein DTO280E4_2498 [Paecilomyces variotii]|nr:hypothetical protein DTO217A2_8866 [Paecilomyces variotii]KAJ9363516.1 hypothetical protein DTO280E4_2498 [Paecilomyces variotii]